MKMAVVGCEASGKTVFMCALADYYGRAAADNPMRLKLTPENPAANNFERYQFRQMRCLRQWPPATPPNRTITVKWSLRRDGDPLAEIDMLEFGGETFRAAFRDVGGEKPAPAAEASVKELTDYLSDADFFVVLVSIKSLLTDAANTTDEDYARETEALWVTRGILDFIRKNRPKAGVVIGLTQADRYRNELGEAGGPRKLLEAMWPSIGAAAKGYDVVDVASVSKTDDAGNPAPDYRTHGILPVMQAFSRHCFGDPDALENGGGLKPAKRTRTARAFWPWALGALLVGLVGWSVVGERLRLQRHRQRAAAPVVIEKTVTNVVEKVVVETVTNAVAVVVEKPVTNTVEKIVEKKSTVTNTVERIVDRPVTNTVEKIVERMCTVTNTVERIVEMPVTNTVEKIVEIESEPADPSTTGYRAWTDYNGRKIVARWVTVNSAQDGITIVNRNGKRIEAVIRKFSLADRAYIKGEIVRHTELGETLQDGKWVKSPLMK